MDSTTVTPNTNSTEVTFDSNDIEEDGTVMRTFVPLGDLVRSANNGNGGIPQEEMEARLKAALEKTFGSFLSASKPKAGSVTKTTSTKKSSVAPKDGESWTVPESGKYYYIKNVGNNNAQWLDVANARTEDDAPVVSWNRSSPVSTSQVWRVVKKGDDGVYTIQNVCTLVKDGKIRNDRAEKSFLRVKEISNEQKLIHGSEAFQWKIVSSKSNSVAFKLEPYLAGNDSELVLSTVSDQLQNVGMASPQLRAEITDEDATKKKQLFERQLWVFVEVPTFVLKDQKWL